MKTFIWIKIILKTLEITSDGGLALQFSKATMNLAPIGVLMDFWETSKLWEEFRFILIFYNQLFCSI